MFAAAVRAAWVGWLALVAPADEPTAEVETPIPSGLRVEYCATQAKVDIPAKPKWVRHKVITRETVDQIAYRYGVTPWELRGWNGLQKGTERVRRGTRLRVKALRIPPARELITYTIAEGDTWLSVAEFHGVDSWDLRAYNWPYRKKMRPGNELKIWVDPILRDWVQSSSDAPAGEGSTVVRRGAVGIGSPDAGRLLNGTRIPEGEGYRLRFPKTAYGTTHAVEQVLASIRIFQRDYAYAGRLAISSMSSQGGGKLGHHKSHQTGRDLDIRLPRREGVPEQIPLKLRRVDWLAAWELIKAISQTDVVVVFLDYKSQKFVHRAAKAAGATDDELGRLLQFPRGSFAHRGIVRHYPGHEKHLHVRWACGPCEPECLAVAKEEPQP